MSTRLKNLLSENTITRRVDLMRLNAILENVASKLEKKEQEKLASTFVELQQLVETLNKTPYTIFNNTEWKLLEMVLTGKVAEMKLIVEDIAKDNKNNKEVDCWPLIKAIDLILTY
jgi:hypothetical protein